MTEVFKSKLSTTRAGDRTRIWIEGTRLASHGFTCGLRFARKWTPATLTLTLISQKEFDASPLAERGTVSGKGEKPIIDITGAKVAETFGIGTHVAVTYARGVITIRREA
jgi:hypothetical protein